VAGSAIVPFAVVDSNGEVPPEADAFLRHLALNGRSPYTVRSYALALADFHDWCAGRGLALRHVVPADVQAYVGRDAWSAATTNHRLSLLAGYFRFLIEARAAEPGWQGKTNPVPSVPSAERSVPMRRRTGRVRADLRRRVPKRVPRHLARHEIDAIYAAAHSWRDRALLKLLEWSGQRIGDWHPVHGRHGLLGLRLADIDPLARTITVRLKGTRDEHVVPVAEEFWPVYQRYLDEERGAAAHPAAWIALRKGRGCPLRYASFETAIRQLRRRSGVCSLTAHAFRHTFAQNMLNSTGNLALVQAFLAHSSPETTAKTYARISLEQLLGAVRAVEAQRRRREPPACDPGGYAFTYDGETLQTLESLFEGR
jgi:site-specific recombinase XerD